jgi:predicted amidohydrolase YtcJ
VLRGCRPELAAGPDGRITAVGVEARVAAGSDAELIELEGEAWPGLIDAHLHLEGIAARLLGVDLTGSRSLDQALARVSRHAASLPATAWVVGRGWYNDAWPDPTFPDRHHLDRAAAGRPVFLVRKDGHSAWLSTAGLAEVGIARATPPPEGGVIDRDAQGDATGIVREKAVEMCRRRVPPPSDAELDRGVAAGLRGMARHGLTSVQSMDTARGFASMQRLQARGALPIRITYNLPAADLKHAERMGIRSGWGNELLRIWGVKAFLDGSLGSRTAEMLDGTGVSVMPQEDLVDLARRCAAAELNICLHAIGDGAVRRALDALEPLAGAWARWRPRVEHAQSVDPADMPRFRTGGVIASMQPIHAVSDRKLADQIWGDRCAHSYAWAALAAAGARLAFGSDAPVEDASPLLGMDAATAWRRRARWYPELAVSGAVALRAYTAGPAYAVGMERDLGRLAPGYFCDATVVANGRVEATIVGGRLVFRRPPR